MKKTIKMTAVLVTLAAVLFATGCSSAKLTLNPDANLPIEFSNEAPVFVFPISLHIGASNNDELGLGISAALLAEFGPSVIPGQQLYDLVGNLSWTLGEAIRRKANSGEWEMGGYAQQHFDELTGAMDAILGMLSDLGLLPEGYQFKYIVVLHADSQGGLRLPKTKKFKAFGGVYEPATNLVLSYYEKTVTVSDDPKVMLANVPMAFVGIMKDIVTAGAAEETEEEA